MADTLNCEDAGQRVARAFLDTEEVGGSNPPAPTTSAQVSHYAASRVGPSLHDIGGSMGARATEARRVSLRPRAQNFLHWSVSRADRTCRPYSRTSGDPYPHADRLHQLAANSLVVFGANVSTDQAHAWLRLPSQPPPKDGCADTTPARKEASSASAEDSSAFRRHPIPPRKLRRRATHLMVHSSQFLRAGHLAASPEIRKRSEVQILQRPRLARR